MTAAAARAWTVRRDAKARRVAAAGLCADGKMLDSRKIVEALQTLIRSGDRVAHLEHA